MRDRLLYLLYLAFEHPYWAFLILVIIGWLLCEISLAMKFNKKAINGLPKISLPFTFIFHLFTAALFVFTFYGAMNVRVITSDNPLLYSVDSWQLVGPCFLLSWLGSLDDRRILSSRIKFILIAVLWFSLLIITLLQHEYYSANLRVSSIVILSYGIGLMITLALPLIDGVNGLYAGVTAVYLFPTMFHAGCSHCCSSLSDLVVHCLSIQPFALLIVPFLLGFLFVNLTGRARLGEAAVMPIAFIIAYGYPSRALKDSSGADFWGTLLVMLILFSYPLMDLAFVVVSRYRNGRSLFSGGHDHLHHRLIQSGLKQLTCTIVIIVVVAIPVITMSILMKTNEYMKASYVLPYLVVSSLPLFLLFWRGYTKVNPYKSGAVDERGRP